MVEPRVIGKVRRAGLRARADRELLELAIVEARLAGHSLRAIAEAAGVSNPAVLKLLRRRGVK